MVGLSVVPTAGLKADRKASPWVVRKAVQTVVKQVEQLAA
jgi:hypothetical protein